MAFLNVCFLRNISIFSSFLNRIIMILLWMLNIYYNDNQVHCMPCCLDNPLNGNQINNSLLQINIDNYQQQRNRRFLFSNIMMVDNNKLPLLYIGEVDLSDRSNCSKWIESFVHVCQRQYEDRLRKEIVIRYERFDKYPENYIKNDNNHYNEFYYDRNDEYIKKASCCGMWKARHCLIERISLEQISLPIDCPTDLIKRYQQLPNEPKTRSDVMDYCSEYSDGSLICNNTSALSNSILNQNRYCSFMLFLLLIIMLI